MARRASSKSSPATTIGIIAAVVILLGGGFLFLNKKPAGISGPAFPVDAFRNNANSLRGNIYAVEGQVHSIRPQNNGKFIDLRVTDGGSEKHIFVVVPNTLTTVNIEREQKYAFKVEIKEGGIPEALELVRL